MIRDPRVSIISPQREGPGHQSLLKPSFSVSSSRLILNIFEFLLLFIESNPRGNFSSDFVPEAPSIK